MPKTEIQKSLILKDLRNQSNFEEDLLLNDFTRTGMKVNSLFNEIGYFHSVYNYAPDIMHDILEGAAIWDLKLVLNHFINKNILKVSDISGRIKSFNYGPNFSNKPKIPQYVKKKNSFARVCCRNILLVKFFSIIVWRQGKRR